MKKLELYLHIPFCVKKCAYCDFLSAPAKLPVRISYVTRLLEEIKFYAPDYRAYEVDSIFIGGGTPTLLEGEQISAVMECLKREFRISEQAEISIECNPGTLTAKKAVIMRESGINRISIGLQSAVNQELGMLGRIHTYEEFLESFDAARKAGFRNINVDLMSALPGQTPESWEKTLRTVTALHPEHLSAYSLMIEEGTPFYEQYQEDELLRERGEQPVLLPSEEEERNMYELTGQFLASRGYHRYEISNYAREGFECRHNVGYWTRKNYLGLGLGASSLIENERFQNPSDLERYMTGSFCHEDCIELSRKEQMEEFMFLGLRLMRGVSREQFMKTFHAPLESIYGDVIRRLKQDGYMRESGGYLSLTERGIDVSNQILTEFLL